MKIRNLFVMLLLGGSLIFSGSVFTGCASWSNTGKGAAIGAGSGAALGAGIGALAGKGKGAAIGAAGGAAVGSGTGALIGRRMDKQKKELEAIEGAKVESVQDVNNLQAIKVTFDNGILFATNKSSLDEIRHFPEKFSGYGRDHLRSYRQYRYPCSKRTHF